MARTRQYADRVNIIKMVKVDGKWPFARVVERNGKLVRDHVWVKGRDEHRPFCERIFLHKFRHTFATQHLRDGVDIRTLQNWMGHRDLKSTMVYLKGVQSKDALAKVNAGALAAYVA